MAFVAATTIADEHRFRSIVLNDTTLRDGEQAPGMTFTTTEKVSIARALAGAGITEMTMTTDGILARLNKASAAEEFFELLGVEYEAKIVNVARLHILRRMGQYLACETLSGASDPDIALRCKATLERAYADFVTSSPIEQRVFKVLKDAAAQRPNKHRALVQLGSLE